MAPKVQPAWKIYEEQMESLCYGHALWEPTPTSKYTRVSIGDVGFIRQGRFHLLFSAGLPLGKRKLGVDVPNTFEHLRIGTTEPGGPRDPGCVAAKTSRHAETKIDVTVATAKPLQLDADFSYEFTGHSGAALTTTHSTYNEDSQMDTEFRDYTKRYYKSWVKFAKDKKYGTNLRPVLISGFDMAKDFSMMAYATSHTSVQAGATVSTPMFGSGSWVWRTVCKPHSKHGPQEIPPGLQSSPSGSAQSPSNTTSTEFNQCVFIRYYTLREGLFPKVIRASAGPHSLGSGENQGDYFPELTMQSEPVSMGDEEDTNDAGNESHKVTPVLCTFCSFRSDTSLQDEGHDSWDAIAEYVFRVTPPSSYRCLTI
ncbi:hypothetical protein BJ322DRAFT_524714 [Thelephora terrestris]|uniref:Uncharacterized protein n=1 Tax=Thelephora terrestris TaxID=56493 RepID=A0A9P6LA73_9AGAM|nr:hypothetical protein BJ322DRAFT_524714 [Thelephora terrestris]